MKVDNIVYLNIKIKLNLTIKLGPISFYKFLPSSIRVIIIIYSVKLV